MYLTKQDALDIVQRLKSFESDLNKVFADRGYSLRDNTGRRNALISIAQEKETASVLRRRFKNVIEDGMPGKPDIYISDISKELECKLTSGSKTKGKTPAYSFQTDWDTICQKKKLDYLFIICDREFNNFCVLFFEGLTPEDFFPPGNGSRGKSRMKKFNAMKKVTCLHGDYVIRNDINIQKIKSKIHRIMNEHTLSIRNLHSQYESLSKDQVEKRTNLIGMRDKKTVAFRSKLKTLQDKIDYWKEKDNSYSFILEAIND